MGRTHVGVKVCKLHLRLGLVDGYMVERDFTEAVDIGVKWLKPTVFRPDAWGVTFPVNEAHEVRNAGERG